MERCPAQAVSVHLFPQRRHILRILIKLGLAQQVRDAFALKVALWGDAVPLTEAQSVHAAQRLSQLIGGQRVILSLHTVAVRVLPAAEAALGAGQLPQHVVQRAAGDFPVDGAAGMLKRLCISQGQQSVIIEHLFKMGDQPVLIGGVSGKSTAHMVEQPTPIHVV